MLPHTRPVKIYSHTRPWAILNRKIKKTIIVTLGLCVILWKLLGLSIEQIPKCHVMLAGSALSPRRLPKKTISLREDNQKDWPVIKDLSDIKAGDYISDSTNLDSNSNNLVGQSSKNQFEDKAAHINTQGNPRPTNLKRKAKGRLENIPVKSSIYGEENEEEEVSPMFLTVESKDKQFLPSSQKVDPNNNQYQVHTAAARIKQQGIDVSHTNTEDGLKLKLNKPTTFPTYAEHVLQDDRADTYPDIIHITFEDAASEVVLNGWEDEWFSATYFNTTKHGSLEEPQIDFVYTWVNGSEQAFTDTILPYELNSTLNDPEGRWLASHRMNRYRDWDELRYSIRTVEEFAGKFRNKIQLLVNSVGPEGSAAKATSENPSVIKGKQRPRWLNKKPETLEVVEILAQEDFFRESTKYCLPTFNSLTIENEMWNINSTVDRFFALSDDMLLGKPHAAADIYSPLFGPSMGFKTSAYNTRDPPTDIDAQRFGEKPFLIYSSWLLNRRFGERERNGQAHFGHSLSRAVMREAIQSFPRPALQSTCQRFRGETGFQLYSWYIAFHYTIERHRETLLWSYITQRMDKDNNGNLDWMERQAVIEDLEEGMLKERKVSERQRMFYKVSQALEAAGLEAPKVNVDTLWTSLDGPVTIRDIDCSEFDVNECLAPGFSTPISDKTHLNPVFSTASILDFTTRQNPNCGDCLIKLLLNRTPKGLEPLLPHTKTQYKARQIVVKLLFRYQYTIVEPDALFIMVTDSAQLENTVLKRLINGQRPVGQICLNDDVMTEDLTTIESLRKTMMKVLYKLAPHASQFE